MSRCGGELRYLPPYSPDLNPIEKFFAELKVFIRKHWLYYEDNTKQGFDNFVQKGTFRNAGIGVEES